MARIAKPRDNYRQEALVMNRYVAIVQADANAPEKWKQALIGHLHEAMRLFMEHDSNESGPHETPM